jgi:hypothetical protein
MHCTIDKLRLKLEERCVITWASNLTEENLTAFNEISRTAKKSPKIKNKKIIALFYFAQRN